MMKRFRTAEGNLSMSLDELKKATAEEASAYYQIGGIYHNMSDGQEYIYTEVLDGLALFQGFSGNLLIPVDSLGTFLPDVSSTGSELIRAE